MKVFHLTEIKNLYGDDGIIAKGLIPQRGERSQSIDDENYAIYFTTECSNIPTWWENLYPTTSSEELCVLSFDIPEYCCIKINNLEYYTAFTIPPKRINIASFFDLNTHEEVPFSQLGQFTIEPDKQYPRLIPKKYELRETPIVLLKSDIDIEEKKESQK